MFNSQHERHNMFKTAEQLKKEAAELLKLADEQEQQEKAMDGIVKAIEKAKATPEFLTNFLSAKGLIVLPSTKNEDEKVTIYERGIVTDKGRNSTFKLWLQGGKVRSVDTLAGDAKAYWEASKAEGKDKFLTRLTAEGKKWIESEEGKNFIAKHFPD